MDEFLKKTRTAETTKRRSVFSGGKILLYVLVILLCQSAAAGRPQRIVSLAPHITEIIFKLGAGNRLVARTDYGKFPPAARKIESVGGYLNLDYEKLVRLQPDLILQYPNPEVRRKLESLGFQVAGIPNETLPEILAAITKTGELLGLRGAAKSLRQGIEDTLALVRKKAESLQKAPVAMLVVGRQRGSLKGLYLAGERTYLSELWELCGGRNAFPGMDSRYFSVNKEDLLKTKIDVILEFHPGWDLSGGAGGREAAVWGQFPTIPAVRHSRIFLYTDEMFVIPGPRISQVAVRFSGLLQQLTEGDRD